MPLSSRRPAKTLIARSLAAATAAALVAIACQEPTGIPHDARGTVTASSHGGFATTTGVYRIPYANGTNLTVTRDHHDHTPVDRIDMSAGQGAQIVVAATGVIRAIVDFHGNSPNAGDGLDAFGGPQNDALEHSCGNNPPENTVVGACSDYNNYVWVEHPNGEWSKYTHMGTGTVRLPPPAGFGWSVGDTIRAGQVLGLESDIGQATSSDGVSPAFHLHTEVAVSTDGLPLQWTVLGGFFTNGANLVPRVCDIPNGLYVSNTNYVAAACANNAPPVANAGGPYVVDEGTPLLLDGTGSVDPDGLPLTFAWSPADNLDDASLAQPTFIAGDQTQLDITLTVFDQVEALDASASTTITVNNVAPTVSIDPEQVTVINEGGIVMVSASFSDPGWLDSHTAEISWGVPPGHPGQLAAAPTVTVLTAGGPGAPRTGRVTGTYRYGDTDGGERFTVTVTVTDDDGGVGSASFELTVNNLDPVPVINPVGAVLLGGVPTIVASEGESVPFRSTTTDAGSDDLTLTWNWGDGTTDGRLSLVNGPATDPMPSPTVQPRSEIDERSHIFGAACLYTVEFTATDDDGGTDSRQITVVITGLANKVRSSGYWSSEYRLTKNPDYSTERLGCFLDIVSHVSTVFDEHRALTTLADAADVLKVNGAQGDEDELFDVTLLTAWLNFASGAFALDQLIGGKGNTPATTFHALLIEAETLRTNPARTRTAMLQMRARLAQLNNGA